MRVGGVAFAVGEGDLYALVGAARDDVDHEVYSGREDRLSVTIRYGEQQTQQERAEEGAGVEASPREWPCHGRPGGGVC